MCLLRRNVLQQTQLRFGQVTGTSSVYKASPKQPTPPSRPRAFDAAHPKRSMPELPTEILSLIASFVLHDHGDPGTSLALLSIDKCTRRTTNFLRSSMLRRIRFEHARRVVAPKVACKYASYVDESWPTAEGVVFFYWLPPSGQEQGGRRMTLCRNVLTKTLARAWTLHDVVELRAHEEPVEGPGRPVFCYVLAKAGSVDEVSLQADDHSGPTVVANTVGHAGGNFSIPYDVYVQWSRGATLVT